MSLPNGNGNGLHPAFRWNPEVSAGTLISGAVLTLTIIGSAWTLTAQVKDAKDGVGRVEQRLDKIEPKLDEVQQKQAEFGAKQAEFDDLRSRVRDLEKQRL